MSEQWLGIVAGAALGALLMLSLRYAGLFRWWRRRRYFAQLLLLIAISLALAAAILAVSLLLQLPNPLVGGLLLGGVWGTIAPLLLTSRLLRRARRGEDADECNRPPAR